MKSDESAFWDGSYLLEGVVDQNGYSKDTITIDARLTPPKGSAPLLFEVSGSRTNYAEVINRLAVKVTELLKVNSVVKEWNAADEAQQYFDEAKWALRWGAFREAQAAAESAWALGKRDMECATVRIESYAVPPNTGGYQKGEYTSRRNTNEIIQTVVEEAAPDRLWGLTWNEQDYNGTKVVQYVSVGRLPDPKSIDLATHALQLYYDFSQTLPAGELKAGSAWYRLGVEDLTVASQVLQHFYFVPESQEPAAERLVQLRSLARSVAGWISESPSVHDSYFVGDRIATHDELAHTIEESPNIFSCEVKWGCFWQERPEDCTALYRELMSSPVFCYIHKDFWLRDLPTPRLVAWDENDRKRIPMVWSNFGRELAASTNVLLQLEDKALMLADADSEKKMGAAFANFFNSVFENRDALVANHVEVLYLNWGADDLVSAKTSGGIVTDTKDSLQHLFYSEYRPKLEAMDQEYRGKAVPAGQILSTFEKQKQYLKDNRPHDFLEFAHTFLIGEPNYSKAQALEIQPLLAAYKSNLVAQSRNASGMQKGELMSAIAQVGFVENGLNRTLNPPAPRLQQPAQTRTPKPAPVTKAVVAAAVPTPAPEIVTNVIVVSKYLAIPGERLINLDSSEHIWYLWGTITAHHWYDGRLLLDYEYSAATQWLDEKGNVTGGRNVSGPAIAILDPATEHWDVIGCPEADIQSQNNFYHRSALLHGELFTCDGGQIKKYDFQNRQWMILKISNGNNYELFAVNGHLYAASSDMIFEILDGGKSTQILASTRRNPPASTLDREDLGTPTLFEGPDHSLRARTSSKIFTWAGNDWREDSGAPPALSRYEIRQENGAAKDAYNAALLCFSRDLPLPQKIFLKFAPADAKIPAWVFPTTNLLLFGPETSRFEGLNDRKAGVWLMPVSQLDSAIAAQKQIQLEQKAQAVAAAGQAQKNLLAKYDRNHNGIIDQDEREEALDDPAFIESELDTIDANHNNRLDPEELVYFDANQDKILEPKEQAGIDIAQHLLTAKLLKQFDVNGDNLLDRNEFDGLLQSGVSAKMSSSLDFLLSDANHDGSIDPGELESFLKQQLRRELQARGVPTAALFNQMRVEANKTTDPRQLFKEAVEFYWQIPGSITNKPPFNRRIPPGSGLVTNGMHSGVTQ
ncbi:MAG: EF-hand domain-containing protein [Verrucomicrobiota bacterium]